MMTIAPISRSDRGNVRRLITNKQEVIKMDEQRAKGNRGDLAEQILDRIASDGEFRQQLLNNPGETLKQAGYNTSDEVSGYGMEGGLATTAIGCNAGAGDVKPYDDQGIGGSISLGGPDPVEYDPQMDPEEEEKLKGGSR
jgi:hypothetical protein